MSGEVRPKISVEKLTAMTLMVLIGLLAVWTTSAYFGPDTFIAADDAKGAHGAASAAFAASGPRLVLTKMSSVPGLISGAVASSLIVITLYELVQLGVQYATWFFGKRRKIEAFFGKGAADRSGSAEIIQQTDRLDQMLKGLVDDSDAILKSHPSHRLYKARHWVNRYDIAGGRELLKQFRMAGLEVPSLKQVEDDKEQKPETVPFKVLLGLGFTQEALLLRKQFDPWLRIEYTEMGDALSIRESLLPGNWQSRLAGRRNGDFQEFITLFPLNWSLDSWLANPSRTRDYGVILRHASDAGTRSGSCVYFWVGGFTDRGTMGAGRYLAEHWEALHKNIVRKHATLNPHGDFLIVVEGPSSDKDTKSAAPWTQVADFVVMPHKVSENAGVKWSTK